MVSIDDVSVSSKDAMTSDLAWSGEVCAVRSLLGECGIDRVGAAADCGLIVVECLL